MNPSPRPPGGCYIHVPFCTRKCRYCSFFSVAGEGVESLVDPYLSALLREFAGEEGDFRWDTLYIGGGTPGCLDPGRLEKLCRGVAARGGADAVREYTVEVNPGTVTAEKLRVLRACGVNRLSVGCQSFNDAVLSFLGRIHAGRDAEAAVDLARRQGFLNVSVDIIYAVPGQSPEDVREDLARACALEPAHVSCYELSIDPGTPLHLDLERGVFSPPSDRVVEEMDRIIRDFLGERGYVRYEVSNYALPGYESLHNMHYWRGDEYAGFGAGAVSRVGAVRKKRVEDIGAYIRAVERGEPPPAHAERVGGKTREREVLMTGLRMAAGIDAGAFARRTGTPLDAYAPLFRELAGEGLLRYDGRRVWATEGGLQVLDAVLVRLF